MKTLIEIHALQNFAPSNLNRDDTGAPKDALFGGTRRARLSSQCLKRSIRRHFEQKKDEKFFKDTELADRTKRLLSELRKKLTDKGRPDGEIDNKIGAVLSSIGLTLKGEKTEYLMFLGRLEIANLANLIDEKWDEIGDPLSRIAAIKSDLTNGMPQSEDSEKKIKIVLDMLKLSGNKTTIKEEEIVAIENNLSDILEIVNKHNEKILPANDNVADSGKPKKRKKSEMAEWENEIQEILKEGKKGISPLGKAFLKILDGGKAVDVALFGRMLANMPEKNYYAACQVAHAISTHTIEREFDYYTAMDDLKPDETPGADMIGTVEFNSACFYRYAVVDWEKLVENLQDDRALASKGLEAFLDGFVVSEPTGKQNTFAAHNPPEFVAISVRRNTAPRNLANAFESPIYGRGKSLTTESANRLSAKATALDKLYETNVNARYAVSEDLFGEKYVANGFGEQVNSVPKLIEWALKDISRQEV